MELTANAGVISQWLQPVAAIVDECRLQFDDTAATVSAVDPANVAMVRTEIDAAAFADYSAGGTIGIKLPKLLDVLSLADGETPVHIKLDESEARLTVTAAGLEYEFGVLAPDTVRDEPDLPDLEWPAELVIETDEFDDALTAADFCSHHLRARGSSSLGYEVVASGDVDEMEYALSPVNVERGGTVDSLFNLDYLHELAGPMPEEVRVQLGEEVPADFRYSLLGGNCDVRALLAPRIDS